MHEPMELQVSFYFITNVLLFTSFFIFLHQWRKTKTPSSHKKLPPSPPKLPLIGHLHHLFGPALPHYPLKKLAQTYGPIMYLQLGQAPSVIISSSELAKQVLKLHDPICAERPKALVGEILFYDNQDIAFSPYNEYWRRMREICLYEMLSPKLVRSFSSTRRDEALSLVKSIVSSTGQVVNLSEKLYLYSTSITCRAVFGKLFRDREALKVTAQEAISMAGGFEVTDFFPSIKLVQFLSWNRIKLLRTRRRLDYSLDRIINEHQDNLSMTSERRNGEYGGEDIVDVLLRLKESGEFKFPFTDENIKAVIFDMFAGGTQTSSTTVEWAMSELMRNPSVMEKVQSEIRESLMGKKGIEESEIHKLKYLKLVIKETLRLHPPVTVLPRSCREELELDGYTIPPKAKIFINVWAIGRDPSYWAEPESFKPERFENNSIDFLGNNFEFLPFGAGCRMCPGMHFALANVELPLALLLYHFDWSLPQKDMKPADLDMDEMKGLSVSRKNSLLLFPTSYDLQNGLKTK